jgi:hypothetical protein
MSRRMTDAGQEAALRVELTHFQNGRERPQSRVCQLPPTAAFSRSSPLPGRPGMSAKAEGFGHRPL